MSKLMGIVVAIMLILGVASVAYAATVQGTNGHDITWTQQREDEGLLPSTCTSSGDPDCKGDLTPEMTDNADTVWGQGGWDWVNGKNGGDTMNGGDGMDQLYGQDGQDTIKGQAGHDHLFGDDGQDYIDASDGVNEPGEKEEVHGYRPIQHPDQTWANDLCIIDADPDGAVVGHCERLTIEANANGGYAGTTKLAQSRNAAAAGNWYATLSVGQHNHIGFGN